MNPPAVKLQSADPHRIVPESGRDSSTDSRVCLPHLEMPSDSDSKVRWSFIFNGFVERHVIVKRAAYILFLALD